MADALAPTSRSATAWSRPSIAPTRSVPARSRSSSTTRPRGAVDCCRRRSCRRSGHAWSELRHRTGRGPCLVPREPRRGRGGLLRSLRGGPRQRPAGRARVRGPVRQRPHRVASGRGRRGRHRAPGRWARRSTLAEVDGGPDAAMIALENSPGSGFGLGTDVTELAGIAEAAAARGLPPERIGFCLDTAHAWAAGIDVSEPARDRCLPGRLRRSDRSRPAGDGPPQRLEVGARLAARST